jgi:predicted acyltransferase
MTFPDVVFPAFLFIVGMSIPFATAQRLAAGDTFFELGRHVLTRTLGLLVLGLFMVNAGEGYNEEAMPMPISVWSLGFYGAAILVWSVYSFHNKALAAALRMAGVAALVALALLFRGGEDGESGLTPLWWGILGLIGWAYLFANAVYSMGRGRLLTLVAALGACVIYACLAPMDTIQSNPVLKGLAGEADIAINTSIALCGVVTTLIFFDARRGGGRPRFAAALFLALALLAVGFLLQPAYGVSKIDATPSWALYSAAICVILFAFLYWLIDLKGAKAWTNVLRPAAANPLLTFLIPNIAYALMVLLHLTPPAAMTGGAPGLLLAVACAFAVLALAAGLNRLNIKLHL